MLVVDTVGFAPGMLNGRLPHSEQLHVVERFRFDPKTRQLRREYTARDPRFLTEPSRAAMPWTSRACRYGAEPCEDLTIDKDAKLGPRQSRCRGLIMDQHHAFARTSVIRRARLVASGLSLALLAACGGGTRSVDEEGWRTLSTARISPAGTLSATPIGASRTARRALTGARRRAFSSARTASPISTSSSSSGSTPRPTAASSCAARIPGPSRTRPATKPTSSTRVRIRPTARAPSSTLPSPPSSSTPAASGTA